MYRAMNTVMTTKLLYFFFVTTPEFNVKVQVFEETVMKNSLIYLYLFLHFSILLL